jgi:hypothetical protein
MPSTDGRGLIEHRSEDRIVREPLGRAGLLAGQ